MLPGDHVANVDTGSLQPVRCPVVVGSHAVRHFLHQALRQAADGDGGLVCLLGAAGMGKTRLVDGLAEAARQREMRVLRGRAVERSTPTAYRPLSEALLPVLRAEDTSDDPSLAGFHSALSALLPTADTIRGTDELALAEGLARLLPRLADDGCLLVLEDLHWSDPETLAVVEDLADRLDDRRVLCVTTARSAASADAERRLRTLGEHRVATTMELVALDDAEVAEMVGHCLGDRPAPPEVVDFVQEHADGVPLFVEELLQGLLADGVLVAEEGHWKVTDRPTPRVPVTFAETVERRMRRLDRNHQQVLRAAAVVGREFSWPLLPGLLEMDRTEVLAALRAGVESGLLAADQTDEGFQFRHALARDAIIERLLPPERTKIAAAALEALDESATQPDAGLVAHLALEAGDTPRAERALLSLARGSLQRGALTSCGRALRRARSVAGSSDALLAIEYMEAHAAALGGHVRQAERSVREALADVEGGRVQDSSTSMVHLAAVLARTAVAGGNWEEAEHHARRALTDYDPTTMPGDLGVRLRALTAQIAISLGRERQAIDLASSVSEQAPEHPDAVAAHCEALEVLGRAVRERDPDAAEQQFDRGRQLAERHDLPLWQARALHELGTVDLYRWNLRRDRLLAARDRAAELGAVQTVALAELHLCATAVAAWDEPRALRHGTRCVEVSREHQLATLPGGLVHLGTAYALAGDEVGMRTALDEALEVGGDHPEVTAGIPGKPLPVLAVRRGDLEGACHHLDEAAAALGGELDLASPFWGLWALLRTSSNRRGDEARQRVRQLPGRAPSINPECLALADAVARGRAGDGEAATADVRRMEDQPPLAPRGPWRWLALLAIGQPALEDGWGDGEAWLREATAGFESADLNELASRSRRGLREAGVATPRQGGSVPSVLAADGVTRREVDVLRLLTEELSNPQIADRLHISRRTVERHISELLSKTGCDDRHELAALMHDIGSG